MVKVEILYKNGDEYIGEVDNNKLSGQGFYKFKNGSYYEGEFKDGLFHGKGKLVDKDNDINIVGQFKTGVACGYARVMYADGGQYEGIMESGLRNGSGYYRYPQSHPMEKYQGQFVHDNYEGKGQLKSRSKFRYVGQFLDSQFHGQGQLTCSDFVYVGIFKKGRMEGKGLIKYQNNQYYDGEFEMNKRNGFGKYIDKNGSQYCGQWKDDMKWGKGKIKNKDGTWFEAEYEDDKIKGEVKGDISGFEIVAQVDCDKLNGPIKLRNQSCQIQTSYKNGVKNGRLIMEKQTINGQKVTYHGQYRQGKQVPIMISYSHRF